MSVCRLTHFTSTWKPSSRSLTCSSLTVYWLKRTDLIPNDGWFGRRPAVSLLTLHYLFDLFLCRWVCFRCVNGFLRCDGQEGNVVCRLCPLLLMVCWCSRSLVSAAERLTGVRNATAVKTCWLWGFWRSESHTWKETDSSCALANTHTHSQTHTLLQVILLLHHFSSWRRPSLRHHMHMLGNKNWWMILRVLVCPNMWRAAC